MNQGAVFKKRRKLVKQFQSPLVKQLQSPLKNKGVDASQVQKRKIAFPLVSLESPLKNKGLDASQVQKRKTIFPSVSLENPLKNKGVDASQVQKRKTVLPSMSLDEFLKKRGFYVEEEQLAAKENGYMSDDDIDIDEDELGLFDCDGYQVMETDHIEGTSRNKKTRGKTTCKKIHARTMEEREVVTFDKGQAVGPTAKRVNDLTNFLGTIGRNSHFISLSYTNWHAVVDKRRIWKYVNTKFIIPEEGKKWVMESVRDAWKRHKSAIKKKHFDRYDNIEDMLKNRPTNISENQFQKLIAYWSLPEIQSISRANSESRKKQKWRHKMGPINFGRVRVELRENSENKEEPTQSDVFIATRMGRKGKELDLDTQAVIAELKEREIAGETAEDAFQAVFGKEKPGHVRCYGRSITKTSLKKDGEINKIKQQHAEEVLSLKTELQETREEVQELRNLMKIYLKQNNPGLNIEEALVHAKQCSSHVSNND